MVHSSSKANSRENWIAVRNVTGNENVNKSLYVTHTRHHRYDRKIRPRRAPEFARHPTRVRRWRSFRKVRFRCDLKYEDDHDDAPLLYVSSSSCRRCGRCSGQCVKSFLSGLEVKFGFSFSFLSSRHTFLASLWRVCDSPPLCRLSVLVICSSHNKSPESNFVSFFLIRSALFHNISLSPPLLPSPPSLSLSLSPFPIFQLGLSHSKLSFGSFRF